MCLTVFLMKTSQHIIAHTCWLIEGCSTHLHHTLSTSAKISSWGDLGGKALPTIGGRKKQEQCWE